MTVAMVLGVLFGLSAVLAWRLLFPPAPPLDEAVGRLRRSNALTGSPVPVAPTAGRGSAIDRLTSSIGGVLIGLGFSLDHVEADLRLLDRTVQQHMASKVLLALVGLAMPNGVVVISGVLGAPIGWQLPLLGSLLLAVVFFFVADLTLRSEANERRQAFRHSLGSFLDLVVISLAGGSGVESSLRDAAAIGNGWAFLRLRAALDGAALTGQTPWVALTRLGEDLGVPELIELSSSVSLAGTEGARVRESLAAKAESLRDHALSEIESKAQASTEAMALPTVLLLLGFLLLIGYPSISLIGGG